MAEDTEVLPRQLTVGVSLEVRELVSREFPLPVAHLVVDVKYGSRLTGVALNSSPHRHDAVLRYPVIGKPLTVGLVMPRQSASCQTVFHSVMAAFISVPASCRLFGLAPPPWPIARLASPGFLARVRRISLKNCEYGKLDAHPCVSRNFAETSGLQFHAHGLT